MAEFDAPLLDYLTDVVLDESANRQDRLFSISLLLEHANPAARSFGRSDPGGPLRLARIASECRDPFLRKVAMLSSRRHQLSIEIAAIH